MCSARHCEYGAGPNTSARAIAVWFGSSVRRIHVQQHGRDGTNFVVKVRVWGMSNELLAKRKTFTEMNQSTLGEESTRQYRTTNYWWSCRDFERLSLCLPAQDTACAAQQHHAQSEERQGTQGRVTVRGPHITGGPTGA